MARRRMPVGGHGEISVHAVPGGHRARARYCDRDGRLREVSRTGKTKASAKAALVERLAEIAAEVHTGRVSSSARFKTVAEAWWAEFATKATAGTKSPTSARTYRSMMRNNVLPHIGELPCHEVTPGRMDAVVKRTDANLGVESARIVRTVLKNVGAYGVRQGVWDLDPSRSLDEVLQPPALDREVRALTVAELADLRAGLARVAAERQVDKLGRPLGRRGLTWSYLPDLVEVMLATGIRVSEAAALAGDAFVPDDDGRPVLRVEAHVVRDLSGAVTRRIYRKGSQQYLLLVVPEYAVPMLARLRRRAGPGRPMFPGMRGQWLHPEQLDHVLRAGLDAIDMGWVSAHTLRRTVGTALRTAGMSTEQVAEQLGNTERVARRHYVEPRAVNDEQAKVLNLRLAPSGAASI